MALQTGTEFLVELAAYIYECMCVGEAIRRRASHTISIAPSDHFGKVTLELYDFEYSYA